MPDADLTPEQIEEGLRLDAARTPGGWTAWCLPAQATQGEAFGRVVGPTYVSRDRSEGMRPDDACCIAHAVSHYGPALRQLRRQAEEIARLCDVAHSVARDPCCCDLLAQVGGRPPCRSCRARTAVGPQPAKENAP